MSQEDYDVGYEEGRASRQWEIDLTAEDTMPSGHTDDRAMTPYRAALLARLPVARIALETQERRQLNEMVRFGWVEDDGTVYRRVEQST